MFHGFHFSSLNLFSVIRFLPFPFSIFFHILVYILNEFFEEFNLKGDILLEKIEKMADGKTVITMLNEFNRTTLDVIAKVNFLYVKQNYFTQT